MRVGRGSRARDRGTSTVEFAIVVPLLLMLVFGIIDFGRMASAHVRLSAAARAAAQVYALGGSGSQATQAANDVFHSGTVTVQLVAACGITPPIGAMARVTVRYRFRFVTPVTALAGLHNTTMIASGAVPCRA